MPIRALIQRSRLTAPLLAAGLLALAGVIPARAHTVTVANMARGVLLTQAQCASLPQAVWLNVMGRDYCIRYYLSVAGGQNAWPAVFLQGDRLGKLHPSGAWLTGANEKDIDTDDLMRTADAISRQTGTTAIYLGRVGVEGSSGDHRIRHSTLELNVTDAALEEIKRRHGFKGFHLIGQSGGAKLIGALLALRNDIGCAVMGSAGLSEPAQQPRNGLEYFNVADAIPVIVQKRSTRMLVITDPADRLAAAQTQTDFVRRIRQAGGHIEQYLVEATDPQRHGVSGYARAAAADCMRNASPAEIAQNLQQLVQQRFAKASASTRLDTPAAMQPRAAAASAPAPQMAANVTPPVQVNRATPATDTKGVGTGGTEVAPAAEPDTPASEPLPQPAD